MPAVLVASLFLVVASVANLPIVYAVVARDGTHPWPTLVFGFLSIGLAWAGGFALQRKWRAVVLPVASLGVLEGVFAFTPLASDMAPGMRAYMIAAAAFALASLGILARVRFPLGRRERRAPRSP